MSRAEPGVPPKAAAKKFAAIAMKFIAYKVVVKTEVSWTTCMVFCTKEVLYRKTNTVFTSL